MKSLPDSITRVLFFAVTLTIAAFLLFTGLGNQYLWQDEAETAILAKNISISGLPEAFDGRNTVLLLEIPEFSKNYILEKYWMGQPWLGIYLANISFRMFGVSTFSARFPFALIGLFSIMLTFLVADKLFRDKTISFLSMFLSATSIPVILHFRQCRYFSPGIFLTLLCVYLYILYNDKKRFSLALLLASLFLLLNTSISFFLSTSAAIVLHMILVYKKNFFSRRNIVFLSFLLLSAIPILAVFRLPRRMATDPRWMLHNLKYYVRSINRYIFPWRSIVILYAGFAITRRRFKLCIPKGDRSALLLIGILFILTIASLLPVNFNTLRYVIHIAPILLILEAYIIVRTVKRFRFLFIPALIGILVFTNVFSISFPVKSYFAQYVYEITHDYDGPSEGIVKYLNANANPKDTVKVAHRFDNPIIFYTDLRVDNMPPFDNGTLPEWIVVNSYWNKGFAESDYYEKIRQRYNEIVLPYPDIPWENRPDDMGYHKFRTDMKAPRVKIYKRRG